MTFTSRRLVGNRVMVHGTDTLGTEGQTILDSTQWDEINADKKFIQATEVFDAAVEKLFAPLTEAADQLNRTMAVPDDPASYVVVRESVTPVAGDPGHIVRLNKASVILRLIEQGDTDRLVWVNSELEVLEVGARATDVVLPGTTVEVQNGAPVS